MQWIHAKKTGYSTSVHKLRLKNIYLMPVIFTHIGTSNRNVSIMAPVSIRAFNSQLFHQNIHACYLPEDGLWQERKSEYCLFRCLKQFQYCINYIFSLYKIGYYLSPDDTSVCVFIFTSNDTI